MWRFSYIEIDLICSLLLIYVFCKGYINRSLSANETHFQRLLIFAQAFVLFDMIHMLQYYDLVPQGVLSANLVMIGYYLSLLLVGVHWFGLVSGFLKWKRRNKWILRFCYLPFVLLFALVLLSPHFGFIYRFGENLKVERGYLNFVFFAVQYGYLLVLTGAVLLEKEQKRNFAAKARRIGILLFPIPVIAFSIWQLFWPYHSLMPVGCVLAILLCHMEYRSGIASVDQLTLLGNRRLIWAYMEDFMEKGKVYFCIMIDIDRFKTINDTYGHVTGDILLVRFANLLKTVSERYGFVAGRYAGDEFLVACKTEDEQKVIAFCEELERGMLELKIPGTEESVSASMGYARSTPEIKTVSEFVSCADSAMYLNKKTGKGVHENVI